MSVLLALRSEIMKFKVLDPACDSGQFPVSVLLGVVLNLKQKHNMSFREQYRALELPCAASLKETHEKLDHAVCEAYGMTKSYNTLTFLIDLNQSVPYKKYSGESVVGVGPALCFESIAKLVTIDCLKMFIDGSLADNAAGCGDK